MSMLRDLGTMSGTPAIGEMGAGVTTFQQSRKKTNTNLRQGLISKPAAHLEMWDRDFDLIHISSFTK